MSQTPQEQQPLDRKDLKIQALRERLAEITVQYEDRDADRRVALTEAGQYIEQLEKQVSDLSQSLVESQAPLTGEGLVPEDEVPEVPAPAAE